MPAHTARAHPALILASNNTAEIAPTSPLPIRISKPASTHRSAVTERMVETVMILTILRLEEELIPAQGVGDTLYVYASDTEIAHDVRRTLEIFDGDMDEAINNICTFVIDGVL